MESQALAEALQGLPFTGALPPAAIDSLSHSARRLEAPAGTVLFREAESNDRFYIILTGRIALEMCAPARGCTRLLTLGPGDILAWSALLGGERMTASGIALEESELIEFSGAELLRLCDADHDLGYLLMRRLAESLSKRLLATRLQLLDLFETQSPPVPEARHGVPKS